MNLKQNLTGEQTNSKTPETTTAGLGDRHRRLQKALLTKDLQQASACLSNAFRSAQRDEANNKDLIKRIREQQKAVGALIVEINGGPVLSLADMVQ